MMFFKGVPMSSPCRPSASGAVTDAIAYDAFGSIVSQTGSTLNEFLYRGEQLDPALAMYYLRARWYRPNYGRFLTLDSLSKGDPGRLYDRVPPARTHHLYKYANADPVNRIDPSGHGAVLEGTIQLTRDVFNEVQLANAFACGVSVGLLSAKLIFIVEDPTEVASDAAITTIGCGLSFLDAEGVLAKPFVTFAGAAVCAVQIASWANEFNKVINDPNDKGIYQNLLSAYDTVVGCVTWYATETILEEAVEVP